LQTASGARVEGGREVGRQEREHGLYRRFPPRHGVRPRRRREDRRRAVGPVRSGRPRRSVPRLLAGETPGLARALRAMSPKFVPCWRLLEPGDKVAVMMPNYLQTWGLAQNFGAEAKAFQLHEKQGWEPYVEEIRTAIAPGTKLVVVTNPHNPTGHVLGDAARKAILERAAEVGAWVLADEVYQGAERDGKTTPSFWGSGYNKVIIVNGLSKAYGLPGLRIGWIVSQPG